MQEIRCKKCFKLLAIKKNKKIKIKNSKAEIILDLEDKSKNEIKCICGEILQVGTWDPRGPGL